MLRVGFEPGTHGLEVQHPNHSATLPPNLRASISSMTENSEALLPVISASIGGRNGLYKNGNVLLDSGAQKSLIRIETATSLGLEGKSVSKTITKVGGEKEEMITKVFNVQVTSLDNKKTFPVKANRYSLYQLRYSRHQDKGYHRRFVSEERKHLPW